MSGKKTIKFHIEPDSDTEDESTKSNKIKASKASGGHSSSSIIAKKVKAPPTDSNAVALLGYLNAQKQPIVKRPVEALDDEERELLERIGKRAIDLDGLLKFKEPQAKNKLWKIPYSFDQSKQVYEEGDPSTINRFGTGINDGCFVSLSLPVRHTKEKNWSDINKAADEILEKFEQSRMSRLNRTRRGSILQPTHVYLTPNPETGQAEYIIGNSFEDSRAWHSEFHLDSPDNQLLGVEFKQHICENVSLDNLANLQFADAGGNGGFLESDLQFAQAVQNRRRASLMPPRAGGDLAFQRQSFAGGSLWSPNLEKARKKAIYQEKVQLINPDYKPPESDNEDDDDDDDEDGVEKQVVEYSEPEPEHYPELIPASRTRAMLFAYELTLIVRQHFIAIKESEIVNFITHSGQHNLLNSCPHVKALLHFQNRIIRLISTYILKHDELEERVEAILFFIETIRQLYLVGNWHSVNLVTQSLQCPPVVRLKETWRRITFGHHDDYSYFLEISEHLRMGKELVEYETLKRFLAVFDDVIDKIRERCGLKLVLIQQGRLKSTWTTPATTPDGSISGWIDAEIQTLRDRTASSALKTDPAPIKKKPKKAPFFKRFFFCSAETTNAQKTDDGTDEMEEHEPETKLGLDENSNQQFPETNSAKMPSCKKFWSVADYNKLKDEDRELIKQEIVRTLVSFQKSAFFVFEDRDPELKDFLLNCRCESMDANMKRSREVENEMTSGKRAAEYQRRRSSVDTPRDNQSRRESVATLYLTSQADLHVDVEDDPEEVEQMLESRHGNRRRVMFAEDFDEPEDDDHRPMEGSDVEH